MLQDHEMDEDDDGSEDFGLPEPEAGADARPEGDGADDERPDADGDDDGPPHHAGTPADIPEREVESGLQEYGEFRARMQPATRESDLRAWNQLLPRDGRTVIGASGKPGYNWDIWDYWGPPDVNGLYPVGAFWSWTAGGDPVVNAGPWITNSTLGDKLALLAEVDRRTDRPKADPIYAMLAGLLFEDEEVRFADPSGFYALADHPRAARMIAVAESISTEPLVRGTPVPIGQRRQQSVSVGIVNLNRRPFPRQRDDDGLRRALLAIASLLHPNATVGDLYAAFGHYTWSFYCDDAHTATEFSPTLKCVSSDFLNSPGPPPMSLGMSVGEALQLPKVLPIHEWVVREWNSTNPSVWPGAVLHMETLLVDHPFTFRAERPGGERADLPVDLTIDAPMSDLDDAEGGDSATPILRRVPLHLTVEYNAYWRNQQPRSSSSSEEPNPPPDEPAGRAE